MSVFKFTEFINESKGTEMTLYRVVPIKDKDKLDVNEPGIYFVSSKGKIKDLKLKSKSGDMYLMTVKANSSDIDEKASEKESENQGFKVVALKDESDAEIVKVEPYK